MIHNYLKTLTFIIVFLSCKPSETEDIVPANHPSTQSKVEVVDLSKILGIPKDFDINPDGSQTILSFDKDEYLTTFDNTIGKSTLIEAPLSSRSYYKLLVDSEGNSFIYPNEDSKFTSYVKYDNYKRFTLYQRSPDWYSDSDKRKYPNTIVSEQKYFTVFQYASKSKKGFLGGNFNVNDLVGFVEINSREQKLITNYTKLSKLGNESVGYPRFVKEDVNSNIWATYITNFGNTNYLVKYGKGSVSNKIIKLNDNGDEIPIFFPLPDDDALVFSNHSSKISLLYVNSTSEIKKIKDLGDYVTIQNPVLDKEGYLWYFNSTTLEIIGINKTGQVKSIFLSEHLPQTVSTNGLFYMNYVFRYDETRGLFYVMFSSNNTSFKSVLCKVKK